MVFENQELARELAERVAAKDLAKCKIITIKQADKFHDPKRLPDMFQLLIWNGLKGEL
ncbi:MAG: hypothetical protein HY747_00665 [Elusimicrobia bacterium]|nr:hypothetical protein [Elusimicrobiota bacterium]